MFLFNRVECIKTDHRQQTKEKKYKNAVYVTKKGQIEKNTCVQTSKTIHTNIYHDL